MCVCVLGNPLLVGIQRETKRRTVILRGPVRKTHPPGKFAAKWTIDETNNIEGTLSAKTDLRKYKAE